MIYRLGYKEDGEEQLLPYIFNSLEEVEEYLQTVILLTKLRYYILEKEDFKPVKRYFP